MPPKPYRFWPDKLTMPPVYFGMYLLQQMTLATIFSWWLAPLVSKGVKSKPDIPPLPFYEASPPRNLETARFGVDRTAEPR